MTDGLFGGAIEDFDPEFVVPMALYLVSEACRLTGEVFSAGGGRFARVVDRRNPAAGSTATRRRPRTCASTSTRSAPTAASCCPASLAEEIELARSVV